MQFCADDFSPHHIPWIVFNASNSFIIPSLQVSWFTSQITYPMYHSPSFLISILFMIQLSLFYFFTNASVFLHIYSSISFHLIHDTRWRKKFPIFTFHWRSHFPFFPFPCFTSFALLKTLTLPKSKKRRAIKPAPKMFKIYFLPILLFSHSIPISLIVKRGQMWAITQLFLSSCHSHYVYN